MDDDGDDDDFFVDFEARSGFKPLFNPEMEKFDCIQIIRIFWTWKWKSAATWAARWQTPPSRTDVLPWIKPLWRGAEHGWRNKNHFCHSKCNSGLGAATSCTWHSQNKGWVCFLSPFESQVVVFRCWTSSRSKDADSKWRLNMLELFFCHNLLFSFYF